MSISKATAQWEGNLREGRGTMKPEHATEAPFSVSSRFEGGRGSNPEELIGAALSGCFSMALAAALGKGGKNPRKIDTSAAVHLDKKGEGFEISGIELSTIADVPEMTAEEFTAVAEETKKNCPVSKALAATRITLTARLA
jgi:osmotically inducible protein OsmC